MANMFLEPAFSPEHRNVEHFLALSAPLLVLAGLVSIRQTSPPTSHISNHTCLFVHYISLSRPSLFVIFFPVSSFSFALLYLAALIQKLVYL